MKKASVRRPRSVASSPLARGSRLTRTTTSAWSISAPNDPPNSPRPPPMTAQVPSVRLWSTEVPRAAGDGHHFTAGSKTGGIGGSCGGGEGG